MQDIFLIIASANSSVPSSPPRSRVVSRPSFISSRTAFSILSAAYVSPVWRSSMTADRMSAVGFASFRPACFGALPCTASNIAQSLPIFALGARPRPPTSPAHRSDTMSPYRFGSTITSKVSGFCTNCMQVASTILSSNSICGYSDTTPRATSKNRPSVHFMMFALCTAVTFFRPFFTA